MRGSVIAASAAAVLVAPVLAAQGKPQQEQQVVIPESAWPPDGMCRVWLRDVPERQQPAPTDCTTALRTRPRDATLLLGRPVEDSRALQDARAARLRESSSRSLFDDRFSRGNGFPSIEPRRVNVGVSIDRSGAANGRGAEPAAGPEKAAPIPAAASKAPATTPIIKPPEP